MAYIKAPFQGTLELGKKELLCAVTKDGKRLISQTELVQALEKSQGGSKRGNEGFPRYISAKNLRPYIDDDLAKAILSPIKFKSHNGSVCHGLEAKWLPKICDVWINAYNDGNLQESQYPTWRASQVLIRGLAEVGIIALIDEATGYQDYRKRDELNKILSAYISKELLPRQAKFPPEFYKEIFRLRGWTYDPKSIKRPSIIGTYTNELIYDRLPIGVLNELRNKTPKSTAGNYVARFHQSLSYEIGHPHLEKQILSVITLMRASDNRDQFKNLFEKSFPDPNKPRQTSFELALED